MDYDNINNMSEKEALMAISRKKWVKMVKVKDGKGFEPKELKITVEPNSDKKLDPAVLSEIYHSKKISGEAKYKEVVTLYSEIEPVKPKRANKLDKAIDECEDLLNAIKNMVIGFNVDLDTLSKYD